MENDIKQEKGARKSQEELYKEALARRKNTQREAAPEESNDLDMRRVYENSSVRNGSKGSSYGNSSNHSSSKRRTKNMNSYGGYYEKPKKTFFWKALLITIIILAIGLGALLFVVWGKLAGYQKSFDAESKQKEYGATLFRAPQDFFENYLTTLNADELAEVYKAEHTEPDTDEAIRAFIQEKIIDNDYEAYKAKDFTDAVPKYVIMTKDHVGLAEFTLAGLGANWSMSSVKVLISGDKSGAVAVPRGCLVYCNGTQLADGYIGTEAVKETVTGYDDKLTNPVEYIVYEVKGLTAEPSMEVASDSSSQSLVLNDDGIYRRILAQGASTYQGKAKDFIAALLKYYSAGKGSAETNMEATLKHVASGSEAAKVIRNSLDGVMWTNNTGADYEINCSDVYVLADNCYAVDVAYYDKNSRKDDEGEENGEEAGEGEANAEEDSTADEQTEAGADEGNTEDGSQGESAEDVQEVDVYRVYFIDEGKGFGICNFAVR